MRCLFVICCCLIISCAKKHSRGADGRDPRDEQRLPIGGQGGELDVGGTGGEVIIEVGGHGGELVEGGTGGELDPEPDLPRFEINLWQPEIEVGPSPHHESFENLPKGFEVKLLRVGPNDEIYFTGKSSVEISRRDNGANFPTYLYKWTPEEGARVIAGFGHASLPNRGNGGLALEAFIEPSSFDVDMQGNIYLTEVDTHQVRKIDALTGRITALAGQLQRSGQEGDGLNAVDALLTSPRELTVGGNNQLFFVSGDSIQMIDIQTSVIQTWVENQEGLSHLAADDAGDLFYYVDSRGNEGIFKVDSNTRQEVRIAGGDMFSFSLWTYDGDERDARQYYFGKVADLTIGPDGWVYALDSISTLVVGQTTSILVAVDPESSELNRFNFFPSDQLLPDDGSIEDGPFVQSHRIGAFATQLDFDSTGNLLVGIGEGIRSIDLGNQTIGTSLRTERQTNVAQPKQAMAFDLGRVEWLASDVSGRIYFTVFEEHLIHMYDPVSETVIRIAGTGIMGDSADGTPALEARLGKPNGLAVDGDGNVYFADTFNQKIKMLNRATGTIETVIGLAAGRMQELPADPILVGNDPLQIALIDPLDVELSPDDRFLYFADRHKVRRLEIATGEVTLFAGNGDQDPNDGARPEGIAIEAALGTIGDIAVGPTGEVMVSLRPTNYDATATLFTVGMDGEIQYEEDLGRYRQDFGSIAISPEGTKYVSNSIVMQGRDFSALIASQRPDEDRVRVFPLEEFENPEQWASRFLNARGMVFDPMGNLYFANTTSIYWDTKFQFLLRKVELPLGQLSTVVGFVEPEGYGVVDQAWLSNVNHMMSFGDDWVYLNANFGQMLLEQNGQISSVLGEPNGNENLNGLEEGRGLNLGDEIQTSYSRLLKDPIDLVLEEQAFADVEPNTFLVSEAGAHAIQRVQMVDPADPSTWVTSYVAGRADEAGEGGNTFETLRLNQPKGMVFDAVNQFLYVVDSGNQLVRRLNMATSTVEDIRIEREGENFLQDPTWVELDSRGGLLIVDQNAIVYRYDLALGEVSVVMDLSNGFFIGDLLEVIEEQQILGFELSEQNVVTLTTAHFILRIDPGADRVFDDEDVREMIYWHQMEPMDVERMGPLPPGCLQGPVQTAANILQVLNPCHGTRIRFTEP